MQLALPRTDASAEGRFPAAAGVPPFNTLDLSPVHRAVGAAPCSLRSSARSSDSTIATRSRANNSQLLLGSRAGFAVSPRDATLVRFTVGPTGSKGGVVAGDHIVAIYGIPLPRTMPMNEEAFADHANDPAYIAMGNLLYGTDESEVPLTVREPGGRVRDVTVTTGEQPYRRGREGARHFAQGC